MLHRLRSLMRQEFRQEGGNRGSDPGGDENCCDDEELDPGNGLSGGNGVLGEDRERNDVRVCTQPVRCVGTSPGHHDRRRRSGAAFGGGVWGACSNRLH